MVDICADVNTASPSWLGSGSSRSASISESLLFIRTFNFSTVGGVGSFAELGAAAGGVVANQSLSIRRAQDHVTAKFRCCRRRRRTLVDRLLRSVCVVFVGLERGRAIIKNLIVTK